MKIKVAQFGLGPIGISTVRLAASKPWLRVVGAVDVHPDKAGQDLGEVASLGSLAGVRVYPSLASLLERARPDVVFHTTVSKFASAFPQLKDLASHGIDVVSSCEELVFPWLGEPRLARKLDQLCRASGARVVGTGVNPGFVMDVLPLCLSSACCAIRSIHVRRIVNASTRREPLQRKIGSGLPPAEFHQRLKQGSAGHAGLKESLALVAHTLGWKLARIRELAEPVVAKDKITTSFLTVRRGQTCGVHQRAEGIVGRRTVITLDLQMYLDAPKPRDEIRIEGEPSLNVVINEGVAGDQATAAALVNCVAGLSQARPGLRLLPELNLPRYGGVRPGMRSHG